MCKFDIYHEKPMIINGKCQKTNEFVPLKINPEKLKQYVVPYIDMTDEDFVTPGKTKT